MKTLFFIDRSADVLVHGDSDDVVEPHSKKLFKAVVITRVRIKSVFVFGNPTRVGFDADLVSPLRAAALVCEGAPDAKIDYDGTLSNRLVIEAMTYMAVTVENPSDRPWRARVVVDAIEAIPTMGAVDADSVDGVSCMHALLPVRDIGPLCRVRLRAGGVSYAHLDFPFKCRPEHVTMRSDAMGDVTVVEFRIANYFMIDGDVPVEFFKGGRALRGPLVTSSNRATIALRNDSAHERWVEIDLGVTMIDGEEGGR